MKKRSYKLIILEKMHLTGKRDIKQYWRLLDKISPNSGKKNKMNYGSIIAKDWVNYFKSMFHTENKYLPHSSTEEGPLDYVITIEEMIKASVVLKNGKSAGLDNITNEMIARITLLPIYLLEYI